MPETKWNGPDDLRDLLTPLGDLHEDPGNPRHHPDRNLDAIEASLKEFGQDTPILVREEDGRVIAGNARLRVARHRLDWTHIAAVKVTYSELKADKRGIADNRIVETGEWYDEDLETLLADLDAQGELDQSLGFDEEDLEDLLDREEPDFDPVDEDEQSQLDEVDHTTCPECGHEFTPFD